MLSAINPHNEEIINEVETLSDGALAEKAEKAQEAFSAWKQYTFAERRKVLKAVAEKMKKNMEEHAGHMTAEMGKPIKESRGEVNKSIWCAEHYADRAEMYLQRDLIESDASLSYVDYPPLGVILGILPWNAPYWLAFRFLAPALMAGNACLIKHDPHVPACAKAIAELFDEVGAPKNLVQHLYLDNAGTEKAIRNPRVQALSFTGSGRAGSIVASIAASEIKHSVLELGGSDPAIVLADTNLEAAADAIAISRIINAGQSCIAAKRILIEESVYDTFTDMLKSRLEKLKSKNPAEEDCDVGPIARADLRDNLHRQIQESIAQGAKCLMGGTMPEGKGFYYPVTLLSEVKNDMSACREETFGPVAVLSKVKDVQEAISIANDTPYGLAASLWSGSDKALDWLTQIESGQLVLNGVVKTDPRLPSGGIKASGFGRELGPHGIKEFVNGRQVWIGPKRG